MDNQTDGHEFFHHGEDDDLTLTYEEEDEPIDEIENAKKPQGAMPKNIGPKSSKKNGPRKDNQSPTSKNKKPNNKEGNDDLKEKLKPKNKLKSIIPRPFSNQKKNKEESNKESNNKEKSNSNNGGATESLGAKLKGAAKTGLKALWIALPLAVKIIISVILIILIVSIVFVFINSIHTAEVEHIRKTLCEAKVQITKTDKLEIDDYLYGTFYNHVKTNNYYKIVDKDCEIEEYAITVTDEETGEEITIYPPYREMNPNEKETESRFTKEYAIYTRSIIYKDYKDQNEFKASNISYLYYNEEYKTPPKLSDLLKEWQDSYDYKKDSDTSSMTTILDIKEMRSHINNAQKLFYDGAENDATSLTKIREANKINSDYEKVLEENAFNIENTDEFYIYDELISACGFSSTCVLKDSGETVKLDEPDGSFGNHQCAAGVHKYMTEVIGRDHPEIALKFQEFINRYRSTGCNANSMDADSYYHGGVDGAIFPASTDPYPGDIWAKTPSSCSWRRTGSGERYYGSSSMHVYVVLEVNEDGSIKVFECNGTGHEECRVNIKNKSEYDNGIFIHVLGECI